MANSKVRKLVWAALFTALTTVATMVIQIPSPTGGYLNAGDALVILGAFFLGPVWGALAAGLGSALADIFAGYILYAPATLIIKGLMALVAGIILRKAKDNKRVFPAILGSVLAEIIMIVGYFAFTATFLGVGMGALAEIPGNCVQAVFGATAGTALFFALSRIPYVKENF
ncbi:MAG: ECF transporter S component [Oscillospiraceae bacterium]